MSEIAETIRRITVQLEGLKEADEKLHRFEQMELVVEYLGQQVIQAEERATRAMQQARDQQARIQELESRLATIRRTVEDLAELPGVVTMGEFHGVNMERLRCFLCNGVMGHDATCQECGEEAGPVH